MPQPIILQDTSGLGEGIKGAGSALADALKTRATAQKQQKYGTVLSDVLSKIDPKAGPTAYVSAYQELSSKTSPEYAQQAMNFLKPYVEQSLKSQAEKEEWEGIGGQPSGGVPQGQDGTPAPGAPAQGAPAGQDSTPLARFSNEELAKMSGSNSPKVRRLAAGEVKLREGRQKEGSDDRKFHTKVAEKSREKVNNLVTKIADQELALQMSNQSISAGDVGPASWANVAKRLNIQELQSPEGAALALSAKINLVGNAKDMPAKGINQYMEQRFAEAWAQVGQSDASNEIVNTYIQSQMDMNKSFVKHYNDIANEDLDKYGYERKDIEERARARNTKDANDILLKSGYVTQRLLEKENGYDWLKSQSKKKPIKGTPNTPAMTAIFVDKHKKDYKKALEEMKKMGYYLISNEEVEGWE